MSIAEKGGPMGIIDRVLSRFQKTDVFDQLQENPSEYHPERTEALARKALFRKEQGRRSVDRKVRVALRRQALEDVRDMFPRLGKRDASMNVSLSGAVALTSAANVQSPKQAIVSQATVEQQAHFLGNPDRLYTVDPIRPDLSEEINRAVEASTGSVLPTADYIQVADQASQKEILDLLQSGNLTKEKFLAFLDAHHIGGTMAKTLASYEALVEKNPTLTITFIVSKTTTDNVLNIALCMRDPAGKPFLANPFKPGEVMSLDSDEFQTIQVVGNQAYVVAFAKSPDERVLFPDKTLILSKDGTPSPYTIGQGETTGKASLIFGDTQKPLADGTLLSILASTTDGYVWVKVGDSYGYVPQKNLTNVSRLPINFLAMENPNVNGAPKVTPESSHAVAVVFASFDLAKPASKPELAPDNAERTVAYNALDSTQLQERTKLPDGDQSRLIFNPVHGVFQDVHGNLYYPRLVKDHKLNQESLGWVQEISSIESSKFPGTRITILGNKLAMSSWKTDTKIDDIVLLPNVMSDYIDPWLEVYGQKVRGKQFDVVLHSSFDPKLDSSILGVTQVDKNGRVVLASKVVESSSGFTLHLYFANIGLGYSNPEKIIASILTSAIEFGVIAANRSDFTFDAINDVRFGPLEELKDELKYLHPEHATAQDPRAGTKYVLVIPLKK